MAEEKRECPVCFAALEPDAAVCPNCGWDPSAALSAEETALRAKAKRFKTVKRCIQIFVVLVMIASTLLGRYLGNWGWAALGFGISLVFTVIVLFITGLAEWYTQVRPMENKEERSGDTDGSNQGDSGADQGTKGDE